MTEEQEGLLYQILTRLAAIEGAVRRLEDQRHPSTLSPEGFEDRLQRFREAEAAMAGEDK